MFNASRAARSALAGALILAGAAAFTSHDAAADRYNRQITFVNQAGSPIMYIYATNAGNGSWGYDHLGQYRVDPGYEITIDLNDYSGYCRFDIRAEFADGTVMEDWSVNACEVGKVTYY